MSKNTTTTSSNKRKATEDPKVDKIDHVKILSDIANILGLQGKELIIPDYLLDKRRKIIKDGCCIGAPFLNPKDYHKNGITGLFDYITNCTKLQIPLLPLSFPIDFIKDDKLLNSLYYITENNTFKIKNLDLALRYDLSKFWKLFINTVRVALEKIKKFDELGNDWDKLKEIMESIWNEEKLQSSKFVIKRHKVNTYGSNNQTKTGPTYEDREQPLFDNDNFFTQIWTPIEICWKRPFEQLSNPVSSYNRQEKIAQEIELLKQNERENNHKVGFIDLN